MKIRKTKKRYKTMFLTHPFCTKVKFKKISTSIETEPRQYPKMCGVFVAYEVVPAVRSAAVPKHGSRRSML